MDKTLVIHYTSSVKRQWSITVLQLNVNGLHHLLQALFASFRHGAAQLQFHIQWSVEFPEIVQLLRWTRSKQSLLIWVCFTWERN